jgi:signal transduction histidine kinase
VTAAGGGPGADKPPGFEVPNVLIVDDQPANLDALEAMLEPLGCAFVRARSGDEALLALLRHDVAAIVLDIRMPGMSGLELAAMIKQRRRSEHVPILFLTAHFVDDTEILRGYGVGGVDYLSKPINAEILRSKVGVFVELFRKTRALEALNEALQREIADRERAQEALRVANQELEARVEERTAEVMTALRAAREARDEAEAASRAKDQFLAMMSHELRNPLNVIAAGMSILGEARMDDGRARTRHLVERQVRHLSRLLDDLLDISRVTSGKIVLNCGPVDLGATVESCFATLTAADALGQHTWQKSIDSVWVNADETRLEQIVTNLVGNAMKFTPAGGTISIRVMAGDHEAVLCVEDSGIGIGAELLPRVFDLFVQGDRSVARSAGGLGLGLTLVRRLAELHGGSASAASEGAGCGASFTVRLPRVAAPARAPAAAWRPERADRKRILVVEDNADGREMLRTMLELQGHDVHEAAEGESAIVRAAELRPDVAIIDIGLPGMDGYAVAARIRASEKEPGEIQLIALTGYGTEQDRRRAAAAGFDAHLTKPVEPDRLRRLLTRPLQEDEART